MFWKKYFDAPEKGILMPLKHALKSDALVGCLVRLMDAPALGAVNAINIRLIVRSVENTGKVYISSWDCTGTWTCIFSKKLILNSFEYCHRLQNHKFFEIRRHLST